MKTFFSSNAWIAVAVALSSIFINPGQAADNVVAAPEPASILPEGIPQGSPVAQVLKLVQAGVDASVIQTYITDYPAAFNLDADKIIALTDAGMPTDLVNAMFAHDKNYLASLSTAAPPAPASTEPATETASTESSNSAPPPAPAPPTEVTINYFNDNLAPYGSWVEVEGYGRCWRPTVVVYDSNWQPYCDRGRWVYTDCGWYWDSEYAWGVTFHYGRWFNSPRYGWCWWPDTVWAPSWVTWRSSSDYCGWAPLPPYTIYQPGIGFTYCGNNVAVSFGFGLASSCYTFVSYANFCQPHPRYYCVPRHQVPQCYNQSTVCNNFGWHNKTIINNGVSVTVIGTHSRHPIQAVPIGSLVNPGRHGWRGQSVSHPGHPFGADASGGSSSHDMVGSGFHRDANPQNDHDQNANTGHRPPTGVSTQQVATRHEKGNEGNATVHSSTPTTPSNNRDQRFAGGNVNRPTQPAQTVTTPVNTDRNRTFTFTPVHNQSRTTWSAGNNQRQQVSRPYTPPATASHTPAPVVTTAPSHSSAANQHAQVHIESRPQPQPVSPQRSEPRQNIVVHSAPPAAHNSTYVAPAVTSPRQNQSPVANSSNGNGKQHGWMARNP